MIEGKESLTKKNGGNSPDLADSFVMLCQADAATMERIARERFAQGGGAEPLEPVGGRLSRWTGRPWRET